MKKSMSMLLVVVMLVSLSSVVADMQTDMKISKVILETMLANMGEYDSMNEMLQINLNEIIIYEDSVVVCLVLSPWGELVLSLGKEDTKTLIDATWNAFYKSHKELSSSSLAVMFFDHNNDEILYSTDGTYTFDNVIGIDYLNPKYY